MLDLRYLARYNANMPKKPAALTPTEANFPCPRCNSTDKCLNGVPRFKCKNCGKNFIISEIGHKVRGYNDHQKIDILMYYLKQNPTTEYKEYDVSRYGKWGRYKSKIVHKDEGYIEFTRRNIRGMAKEVEISPTTFYKMIAELRVRLENLDIEALPYELKTAVKSALKGGRPTDDLIRAELSSTNIRNLLEFLYLS
jgi:transposase-like protein